MFGNYRLTGNYVAQKPLCSKCWIIIPSERQWPGGHKNPCSGKWSLASSPVNYVHSSAYFYHTGIQGFYPVLNYREFVDMLFVRK
jgi:hypothetical protein